MLSSFKLIIKYFGVSFAYLRNVNQCVFILNIYNMFQNNINLK